MNENMKQVFHAPWKVNDLCEIENANGSMVCFCCPGEKHTANRIALLPELYDALNEAVQETCGACAMMHVNENYDFVENGCPFEENEDCKCLHGIMILRKVRYGK